MRIILSFTAMTIMLGLAGPAFAQAGATQSPPSPNSGASAPTPPNSLPAGAATTNSNSAGGARHGIERPVAERRHDAGLSLFSATASHE